MTYKTAIRILMEIFIRNGYVRIKDESKLKANGSNSYKKGYEIRFLPKDDIESERLQTAISTLNFYVSKTFMKHGRVVQPLYGKDITLEFRDLQTNPD